MSASAQRFEFEGELRTVRGVQELVPRFSTSAIREYLRAGAKTRLDIMRIADERQRAMALGARLGKQKSDGKWGKL